MNPEKSNEFWQRADEVLLESELAIYSMREWLAHDRHPTQQEIEELEYQILHPDQDQ